MGHLKIRW